MSVSVDTGLPLCREDEVRMLRQILSLPWLPQALWLFGPSQSGKQACVNYIRGSMKPACLWAVSSCHQAAVHPRLLYEDLLCQLHDASRTGDNNFSSPHTADNFAELVAHIRRNFTSRTGEDQKKIILVLRDVERLRDMDMNLLPGFLRMQELTGANICVILVSRITWSKFQTPAGTLSPIPIVFEQYNKSQLTTIIAKALKDENVPDPTYMSNFYDNYVSMIVGFFIHASNSLPQLLWLSRLHLDKYKEPIQRREVGSDNFRALWRHIQKSLELSMQTLNIKEVENRQMTAALASGINHDGLAAVSDNLESKSKNQRLHVELPYYSKYLLIASYLASYNPIKTDKRFFMKNHGKVRKTKASIKAKERRVSSQLTGPKAFPLDRMLAIFFAILDDQAPLSADILSQISSLVSLQFLSQVGTDDALDSPKYKCVVSLQSIRHIARQVNFEINRYLYDFS